MPPSKMAQQPQWPVPYAWGHQLGTVGQQMIAKPFPQGKLFAILPGFIARAVPPPRGPTISHNS